MPRITTLITVLIIVLAGAIGGIGLGLAVGPPRPVEGAGKGAGEAAPDAASRGHDGGGASRSEPTAADGETSRAQAGDSAPLSDRAYVKMGRQLIVPVVEERRTEALMLFELALEVPVDMTERAYAAEPRLRDAFLQSLLEMSYTGAFSRTYTDERVTRELRDKLRSDAQRLLQGTVFEVLILDMLRQEL